MNSFTNLLIKDARFHFENGLFYQKDLPQYDSFEENYLKLRHKEGRVYTDDVVHLLPEFHGVATLATEWKIRKRSTDRLIRYLKKKNSTHLLEIGCGNGWLINYLHRSIAADYCGIDINEAELQQAVRVSSNSSSACFVYGDILSNSFDKLKTDMIVVASVAQYFSDLELFIRQLLPLLTPQGEIHILDTPFYNENEIEDAKRRSKKYFESVGVNSSQQGYFHHGWSSFGTLDYTIVYKPQSLINKLKKIFIKDSPFPWIIIKKDRNG